MTLVTTIAAPLLPAAAPAALPLGEVIGRGEVRPVSLAGNDAGPEVDRLFRTRDFLVVAVGHEHVDPLRGMLGLPCLVLVVAGEDVFVGVVSEVRLDDYPAEDAGFAEGRREGIPLGLLVVPLALALLARVVHRPERSTGPDRTNNHAVKLDGAQEKETCGR